MSRRPTCDEAATYDVPMPDKSTMQQHVATATMQQHVTAPTMPCNVNAISNMLSNENVVAFAPGIVIDDGTSSAVSSEIPSEIQKLNESSMPLFTRDDLVHDAVQRCMQRHETR